MNLILWRHAEAEDLPDALSISRSADLQRPLTRRGRKQADASAAWLRAQLPAGTRVHDDLAAFARWLIAEGTHKTAAHASPAP